MVVQEISRSVTFTTFTSVLFNQCTSGNLAYAHIHTQRPPCPTNAMSTSTPPSRNFDTNELKSLIAQDLAASNELAARITQLRQDIGHGKPLPPKKVDLMEQSNKDMTKDLVARVEKVESAANLNAADREMLQALSARLAICDLQAMRLAELRDLELIARGTKEKVFLDAEVGYGVAATVKPEEQLRQAVDRSAKPRRMRTSSSFHKSKMQSPRLMDLASAARSQAPSSSTPMNFKSTKA